MLNTKMISRISFLVLILAMVYGLSWFYIAGFIKTDIVESYLRQIQDKRTKVEYEDIKIVGFPFAMQFKLIKPRIFTDTNTSIAGDELSLQTSVFSNQISVFLPGELKFDSEQEHTIVSSVDHRSVLDFQFQNSVAILVIQRFIASPKEIDLKLRKLKFDSHGYKIFKVIDNVQTLISSTSYQKLLVDIDDKAVDIDFSNSFCLIDNKMSALGDINLDAVLHLADAQPVANNKISYQTSELKNLNISSKLFEINLQGMLKPKMQNFIFKMNSYPKFLEWIGQFVAAWQTDFIKKNVQEIAEFDQSKENIKIQFQDGMLQGKKHYQQLIQEYMNEYLKTVAKDVGKKEAPAITNKVK